MITSLRTFVFYGFFMLLFISGCVNSDADPENTDNGPVAINREAKYSPVSDDFFTEQGLEVKQTITKDGFTGYLAEFKGKVSKGLIYNLDFYITGKVVTEERGPFTKKCMVLTGTPYTLGYQSAMLGHKEAYPMLTQYLERTYVYEIQSLGITIKEQHYKEVYKLMYECSQEFIKLTEPDIPQYLKDEMKGFVDGMKDAGYPDVTYEQVMILNQALDNALYLIGAVTGNVKVTDRNRAAVKLARKNLIKILFINSGIITDTPEKYLKIKEPKFGCNEFALTGSMTSNGHTWHGRDFNFETNNIMQDSAMVTVYLPDRGYPFAAVCIPGVVGQTTALNSKGLSMGQDYVMTDVRGETPGVGCMLVVRDIVQNCSNLRESIAAMRAITRGTSWIYFVADDEADPELGNAVTLETITNQKKIKGPDQLPLWERLLLIKYLVELNKDQLDENGYIDGGVMLRGMKWKYPEEFKQFDTPIPREGRNSIDVYLEYDSHYSSGVCFKDTVETNDEYVIAINHFMNPRLNLLHYELVSFLNLWVTGTSAFRYDTMMDLIEENKGGLEFFGTGDFPDENTAGKILDFLNTQGEDDEHKCWWYFRGFDVKENKYVPVVPENIPVQGSKSLINNDTREMVSLFGYNLDPWVRINLDNFVRWYYND